MAILGTIRNVADRLIDLSATIGVIGLMVEVGIILADVIGRFFGAPIAGAQDIAQMTMVILVFGGMALCDREGGHIAIDLLEASFPGWLNRAGDIASALLGAVVFGCIAWSVYDSSKISQMLNLATNVIYLPKAYFQWALAACAALTAAAMLLRVVELVASGETRRPHHEPPE